ncbi:MAG: hypothetical protein J6X61_01365, partial [Clostridia bacterium]|nr:hypothetical protein [Clostridia bacterium]
MKRIILLLLSLLLLLPTACTGSAETVAFDGQGVYFFDDGYLALHNGTWRYGSYAGGEGRDFVLDPFTEGQVRVLCANEDAVYYSNERHEILRRNLRTDRETVFFRPTTVSKLSLLGLLDAVVTDTDDGFLLSRSVTAMYVWRGTGYVVVSGQLCRLESGTYEPVLDQKIVALRFDGAKVAFVDEGRDVYVCEPDGGDLHRIDGINAADARWYAGELWYRALDPRGSVWHCRPDGSERACRLENGADTFNVAADALFYTDGEGNLYRAP